MKAFRSLLILIPSICSWLITCSGATDGPFEYGIFGDTVAIIGFDCDASEAVVPASIAGYPVTEIAFGAFLGCETLTSVTLPESILGVAYSAFEDCSNLTWISLPSSLTHIGDSAFKGCSSLVSIAIPDSVSTLGEEAFSDCSSLQSVTIGSGVANVRAWTAFNGCTSLSSIEVTAGNTFYTSLNGAVYDVELTTLYFVPPGFDGTFLLPESVTNLQRTAFPDAPGLTAITVPETHPVFSSSGGVLYNKAGNLLVQVPPGMSGEFVIPAEVTGFWFKEEMFGPFTGCSRLESITLPAGLEIKSPSRGGSFGYTFGECLNLTRIEVDEGNPHYSSFNGVLFNKTATSLLKLPPGYSGAYVIPESTTSIFSFDMFLTFQGCAKLTSLTIGSNISIIDRTSFLDCTALEEIFVVESNDNFASLDGVVYDKSMENLLLYPKGRTGGFSVPEGVLEIGNNAFLSAQGLTSVTLPDSLLYVGVYAFGNCLSLTEVNLGSQLVDIGRQAFSQCRNLSSLSLPDSLLFVGDAAFAGCWSLDSVTLPDSLQNLGNYAFGGCMGLRNISIGGGILSLPDFVFAACHRLESVTIPTSITNLGVDILSWNPNLRRVYFLGEPPATAAEQFVDCHPDLVVYFPEGTSGWGETFAGAPTLAFNPDWPWANYETFELNGAIYADTGSWLGILEVSRSPWVWHARSGKWLHLPGPTIEAGGGWVFFPRP